MIDNTIWVADGLRLPNLITGSVGSFSTQQRCECEYGWLRVSLCAVRLAGFNTDMIPDWYEWVMGDYRYDTSDW